MLLMFVKTAARHAPPEKRVQSPMLRPIQRRVKCKIDKCEHVRSPGGPAIVCTTGAQRERPERFACLIR
jgi:hypothetical protein